MVTTTFQTYDDPELPQIIWVCKGPPICMLVGDVAVEAQVNGCLWCKRIIQANDGTERIVEPGHG